MAKKIFVIFFSLMVMVSCKKIKEKTEQEVKLYRFEQEGKYGYLDQTCKTVINPQFDAAGSFSEGLADVKISGKWGYIDKTGKYVINPQFDDAWPFSEGLTKVKSGKKWILIDKTGRDICNSAK